MFSLFSKTRNLILSVDNTLHLEFINNKCTVQNEDILHKVKQTMAFKNGDIFILEDKDVEEFEKKAKARKPRTVQGTRTTNNVSNEE